MSPALETLHAMRLLYWALGKTAHHHAVVQSIQSLTEGDQEEAVNL